MNTHLDKTRLRFYLWVGLAYAILGIIIDVSSEQGNVPARMLNQLWRAVFIVAINFVFFEYTLPFVRGRRNVLFRIFLYLFVFWIQLMLYSFGYYAWRSIGILLHLFIPLKTFGSILEGVSHTFPYSFFSLPFFGMIKHFYDHNQLKRAAQQLLIEKQQAELNYLKAQTNPHFLFNTLNNIYTLARDKSNLASESILRLSAILRFMLHEAGGEYITLEKEVKIIKDYLALEKLRYDDSLRVDFVHEIDDEKQQIPPLLLISLVENAFKHGASETRLQPFVEIRLRAHRGQLEFHVRNSTDQHSEGVNTKENIGLSNLRRQLELLYREYNLSVKQSGTEFSATLTINLASHV